MKNIFYILPFIVSILVVITKKRIVNAHNEKKHAYREMFLDVLKVVLITIVALIANFMFGNETHWLSLMIDPFMLIVYLLPLLQKNYDYVERKALMGIWASVILMLSVVISIAQMLLGTFDRNDTTLAFCFIKGVCYFSIALWCCFTSGKSNKIRNLINGLMDSFKSYKQSNLDYYALAFLGLFMFVGMKDYFTPIGIFGIHEILNKKKIKGILYIVLGNICLFMENKFQNMGAVISVIYTTVALIDLFIHFIKGKKSNSNKETFNL